MQRPTITINNNQKIIVRRLLPGLGEVLVQRGQTVRALDTVARIESPSGYKIINLAQQLGHDIDMDAVMRKTVGETVKAHEIIATRKGLFRQKSVYAEAKGRLVAVEPGWVLLETEHEVTQVQAFVNGTVSRVIANRGVVIETAGAVVQAACGLGGEAHGLFKTMVNSPDESLDPDEIDTHCQNSILLAGRSVDEETLREAEAHEVRGVVVGSLDAALLALDPPLELSVVATEGFGDVPMSSYVFNMLRNLAGQELSIRGVTPSLERPNAYGLHLHNPPMIIAPSSKKQSSSLFEGEKPESVPQTLTIGSRVRVTHGEFLGVISTIDSFPDTPQPTEAGIITPGAYLSIDRALQYIPLANLAQVI